MTRDDLADFLNDGPDAMNPALEGLMSAQLEKGEDIDGLYPARGATVASRAKILSAVPLDWSAEVDSFRELDPGFVRELSLLLATGEIEPLSVMKLLASDEKRARATCLYGAKMMGELMRLVDDQDDLIAEMEGDPDAFLAARPIDLDRIKRLLTHKRPGEGSPDASVSTPANPRPEGPG